MWSTHGEYGTAGILGRAICTVCGLGGTYVVFVSAGLSSLCGLLSLFFEDVFDDLSSDKGLGVFVSCFGPVCRNLFLGIGRCGDRGVGGDRG